MIRRIAGEILQSRWGGAIYATCIIPALGGVTVGQAFPENSTGEFIGACVSGLGLIGLMACASVDNASINQPPASETTSQAPQA